MQDTTIQTSTQPNRSAWEQLAFGWSTPPIRYGPRPARCPECIGQRITAQFGNAHCHDCGHNWAYGGEVQS